MDEVLIVGKTPNGTELYVSELSFVTLADNGVTPSPSGLYLYETCDTQHSPGIRVLASVPTQEAAYRLADAMALTA